MYETAAGYVMEASWGVRPEPALTVCAHWLLAEPCMQVGLVSSFMNPRNQGLRGPVTPTLAAAAPGATEGWAYWCPAERGTCPKGPVGELNSPKPQFLHTLESWHI